MRFNAAELKFISLALAVTCTYTLLLAEKGLGSDRERIRSMRGLNVSATIGPISKQQGLLYLVASLAGYGLAVGIYLKARDREE